MKEHNDRPGSRARRPGERGDVRVNDYFARVVQALAEMEQGMRPVHALDDISSPLAARRIRKLLQTMQAEHAAGRRRRMVATPTVLCASSISPTIGVAEGLVILRCAGRTRPYCVRLEQEGHGWRLVELAPPDAGLRAAVTAASRNGALYVDDDGMRRSSGPDGIPYSSPPMPGRVDRSAPPFISEWMHRPEAQLLFEWIREQDEEDARRRAQEQATGATEERTEKDDPGDDEGTPIQV
jgi:hypothetical protein